MTLVYNITPKKKLRKKLRDELTGAEKLLWLHLKGKGLGSFKFRRQYGVGNFILDFYCPQLKLAIEIDGDSHFLNDAEKSDADREDFIKSFGIKLLRFANTEIYKNLPQVLEKILEFTSPTPP